MRLAVSDFFELNPPEGGYEIIYDVKYPLSCDFLLTPF